MATRLQRFSSVSRVVNAFKAKPQQRLVATTQLLWPYGIRADYYDRTFENYVKEGFKRNELVYSAVSATANTAASVALQIHDKKTNIVDAEHPVRQLIEHPNSLWDEFDLWTTVIVHMKLAGVAYLQKRRDGTGRVTELWPIRPDYVRPVINEQDGLAAFRIVIGGVDVETLPAEDVMRFSLPDPLDMFRALSPVEVLARSADVDNSLTDFLKMFMDRGGVPQAILTTKTMLDDDAIADIQRRWEDRYGGYRNWMRAPAVLDADATYQRIGLSFDEMQFENLDGRNESRICMVLQVPPIIIGATIGLARSTFSNYQEARKMWWEDILMSLYTRLANVVNQQLVPEFDTAVVAEWDFTKVPALQEERNARWSRATAAFTGGVITRNMALEEMGLENVGAEGEVFIQSIAVTEVRDNPADNRPSGTIAPDASEEDDTEGKARKILGARVRMIEAARVDGVEDKALTTATGETLSPADAKEVKPVKKSEIDGYFELYAKIKAEHDKAKNGVKASA